MGKEERGAGKGSRHGQPASLEKRECREGSRRQLSVGCGGPWSRVIQNDHVAPPHPAPTGRVHEIECFIHGIVLFAVCRAAILAAN